MVHTTAPNTPQIPEYMSTGHLEPDLLFRKTIVASGIALLLGGIIAVGHTRYDGPESTVSEGSIPFVPAPEQETLEVLVKPGQNPTSIARVYAHDRSHMRKLVEAMQKQDEDGVYHPYQVLYLPVKDVQQVPAPTTTSTNSIAPKQKP